MNLNCPNCGAPIDPQNNKCSYCKTSYFDLSYLDINNNEPFYLKIKKGKYMITQLVRFIPDSLEITMTSGTTYAYGGKGLCKKIVYKTDSNVETNFTVQAVQDPTKNHLCIMEYIEN